MEFFASLNVWYKRMIAGGVGAIAGYAYYYYIGCMSGTCLITSNPYISTLYGTVIGILLVNSNKKEQKENHGSDNSATADQKV